MQCAATKRFAASFLTMCLAGLTIQPSLAHARSGGAEVLDMADQIRSLAPGKKADLIVLDPDAPNFAPRIHEVNQVVFNAQPSNIEWVFVDGRVLKEKGTLVG